MLVVAASLRIARAHEHDTEEIPDGSAISAEPLVCWDERRMNMGNGTDGSIGCDIMGTYSDYDDGIWGCVSIWDGLGGEFCSTTRETDWEGN